MSKIIRVYCSPNSRLYTKVVVCETRKEQFRGIEKIKKLPVAITFGTRRYGDNGHLLPIFAETRLLATQIDFEVVSHELLHATFCWVDRKGLKLSDIPESEYSKTNIGKYMKMKGINVEEEMCHTHGFMVQQFFEKWCKNYGN